MAVFLSSFVTIEDTGLLIFYTKLSIPPNFLSPHFYEVYVPLDEHLEMLINSSVVGRQPVEIGRLRYTETELFGRRRNVKVLISPLDFIASRSGFFGKTRLGKSNLVKLILQAVLDSELPVGQIVFDLAGEYTYPDPQTSASIFMHYRNRCTRYSLRPRRPRTEEREGVPAPYMLRANFYNQVRLGHATILSLYNSVHRNRPDYMAPFFGWEPVDTPEIKDSFPDISEQKRYRRAHSMYLALLYTAGYAGGDRLSVDLELHELIRQRLACFEDIKTTAALEMSSDGKAQVSRTQRLTVAGLIYRHLWAIHERESNDSDLFPVSESSGKPYFEPIHRSLLRRLGDSTISGPKKLMAFVPYHDPAGRDLITEIVRDVAEGRTVLIDLSSANEVVAQYYSEMVTRAVLDYQMRRFAEVDPTEFEKYSVLFYFEEAHHLFRADDRDLSSIYNRLAKEGGKFRMGMVYATQSLTTLSPDLLKMTENFFIAHVNDDREVKEIERRYEFKDIGLEIQRCRTKGFIRMITQSHRYVLPVQIKRFQLPPRNNEGGTDGSGAQEERK